MRPIRSYLKRLSNQFNRLTTTSLGARFELYYLCEFPRSGGNWLAQMIADCLQLPLPRNSIFPIGCTSVLHTHWPYSPKFRRVVYMTRDGRDVMVSLFFHCMRVMQEGDSFMHQRYTRLFGRRFDASDCRGLLPTFLEYEFRKPLGSRYSWPQHTEMWFAETGHPNVVYAKYESLLADVRGELERVLRELTGRSIDPWRLDMAVEKFSMIKQTGRSPGEEDAGSFVRKGIAGDWLNYFTKESAEIFDAYAGEMLVRLGYEPDRSTWIERIDDARVAN